MSEYDYLFKVIVVGDGAVGKTAITIRFAEGRFEEHYKMTIGVDFAIKLIEIEGYRVKLQVWDTGGQERFSYIRPLYYKGAMAALAIFDLTNRESYDNLSKWFSEVADNCGAIPLMLVGNKSDLPDRAVESSEAQALSDKLGVDYYEASAKSGDNINALFRRLGELLLQSKIPALAKVPATVVADSTPEVSPAPTIPEISPPPSVPTFSPPPTAPSISAPPTPTTIKPPTITKVELPTIPKIEIPSVPSIEPVPTPAPSDSSPTLDEALKILESTEEPTPEPFDLTPSSPSTIDLTPPTPAPTPEPIDLTPPTPEPISFSPPEPEPIDLTLSTPAPIDITPPISEPTPIETESPVPDTSSSFIPFTTTSVSPESTPIAESSSSFIPFSAGPPTPSPTPQVETPSSSGGSSWIDFLKAAPKVEEKKPTFVPFVTSIQEPEEIVLEVVPKDEGETGVKEIICPGCNRSISTAWKFCTYCGAKLE